MWNILVAKNGMIESFLGDRSLDTSGALKVRSTRSETATQSVRHVVCLLSLSFGNVLIAIGRCPRYVQKDHGLQSIVHPHQIRDILLLEFHARGIRPPALKGDQYIEDRNL
jgi:hypothetical protein